MATVDSIDQLSTDHLLDNQGCVCEPWCNGVVSLLDMLQFYAEQFAKNFAQLNAFEIRLGQEPRDAFVKVEGILSLNTYLLQLQNDCVLYKFASVALQCDRIIEKLGKTQRQHPRCGDLRDDLNNLRTRVEDEFQTHYFLHLDIKQADQYQNPEREWELVTGRFSKVRYNVEESVKCFALERYGAAVFHVLQVAEYGVIEVAKLLNVEGDKPGWGSLKRLQGLIDVPYPQRTPLAQEHSTLLQNVVPLAFVIKDSWRHKLDHVDNQIIWVDTDFSPQVAEDIISATRAFMRKLAHDFPRQRMNNRRTRP